jgi:hypothetical protein
MLHGPACFFLEADNVARNTDTVPVMSHQMSGILTHSHEPARQRHSGPHTAKYCGQAGYCCWAYRKIENSSDCELIPSFA